MGGYQPATRTHSHRLGIAVHLPESLRETLVEELDEYLEAFSADPDAEAVVNYVVELLESFADEEGFDDLLIDLEEEGELDGPFVEVLESEMTSNDEFEFTGEEIASLLEKLCGIEWEPDDDETAAEDDEDDF